jgi:dephospho-CoA kinase
MDIEMAGTQTEFPRMIVGVTGGIGSGKTAATDCFAALGITVVDADMVSRDVVKKGKPALAQIAARYGQQNILLADGSLDRKALRGIIFANPDEKAWLESLLHPLIRDDIVTRLALSTTAYTILSSPLLLETDQRSLCDRILVIDAPENLQVSRTTARDSTDEQSVRTIMSTQLGRAERLAAADDVITNDSDLETLQHAVRRLHQTYLSMSTHEQSSAES